MKHDLLFFNISGAINGPKPILSNNNLTLLINTESETNSEKEIQYDATNILVDNYSLICKANETIEVDFKVSVSFIDGNVILLV